MRSAPAQTQTKKASQASRRRQEQQQQAASGGVSFDPSPLVELIVSIIGEVALVAGQAGAGPGPGLPGALLPWACPVPGLPVRRTWLPRRGRKRGDYIRAGFAGWLAGQPASQPASLIKVRP